MLGTRSVQGREWGLHNGNGNSAGEQHGDNRSQPAKYDCSHVWLPFISGVSVLLSGVGYAVDHYF